MSEKAVAWIPAVAAAQQLGVSRQRVYQLLSSGALTGVVVCGTWLVSTKSIAGRIALLRGGSSNVSYTR